ncbi:sensor histidine kinase [Parablautia sp. Marseille-Q6255]|uniref:sensor histidine kinase n=1 Tax=Parablautia sp. Marseille-Q6255 TaxID=3039593 RepID=UPI0024BC6516|nr:HAMP domain-containing sensor histidine kinase [Parablautia sp. Marseille-Q6255]
MRRLSLKIKLTLLYTILMTAVTCGVFALLFSLSGKELLASVQNQLEQKVSEAGEHIENDNGKLNFDSELMSLEYGVYLSVYDADGYLLYGKVPYGFDNSVLFEDGTVRKYAANEIEFYVMDLFYDITDYGSVVIRGVASITAAEASFRFAIRLTAILMPLLTILTAVTGYLMTRRTLRPVSRITDTVCEIQKDGDLSRRVALGKGNDEIYRMADTFDRMLVQLEEGFRREQKFASDASHELRTPVAAMLLQCEELLKDDTLSSQTREGIEMLRQKSLYLSQIISQLLFLTRADQGRQKISLERLDFGELTELACEEAQSLAQEQSPAISIETQIEENLYILGDETLLIRFWMNLLQNAVTYGRPGGHIRVTAQKGIGRIEGTILDDGIGISEEDLPHIWERFYQADISRTREDSSGLGLSMVKWIVKEHGGEITVRSRLGEGTEFVFWFPLA